MHFKQDIFSLAEVPSIARQAQDFLGNAADVLGNILDPRCNRAAWQMPLDAFGLYLSTIENDLLSETTFNDFFASKDIKDFHTFRNSFARGEYPLTLDNGQEIVVYLDHFLLHKKVEYMVEHVKEIGNSLIKSVSPFGIHFSEPDIRFCTAAEAHHSPFPRAYPPANFHMDSFNDAPPKAHSAFTIFENLIGSRTKAIKAELYAGVLKFAWLARGTKEQTHEYYSDRPNYLSDAALRMIESENIRNNVSKVVAEFNKCEVNIFARSPRSAPEYAEQERVYCLHSPPELIAQKRLSLVWRGYILQK